MTKHELKQNIVNLANNIIATVINDNDIDIVIESAKQLKKNAKKLRKES